MDAYVVIIVIQVWIWKIYMCFLCNPHAYYLYQSPFQASNRTWLYIPFFMAESNYNWANDRRREINNNVIFHQLFFIIVGTSSFITLGPADMYRLMLWCSPVQPFWFPLYWQSRLFVIFIASYSCQLSTPQGCKHFLFSEIKVLVYEKCPLVYVQVGLLAIWKASTNYL